MKKSNKPPYYASMCGTKEPFGRVYVSMMRHPAYKRLSLPAKMLYVTLRCHASSAENLRVLKARSRKTGAEYITDYYDYFVFPPTHQTLYGYTDRSNVSVYMRQLIEAGFIQKVEDNRYRFRVTVYRFSAVWKNQNAVVSQTT